VPILLDLNNRVFQRQWFALEKADQLAVLQSCRKILELDGWNALYRDKGFKWEQIHSRRAPDGSRLYSFRMTVKLRAVARREGDFLEILTLHPDHDSAY
jgi:hypothetical protein